MVLILCTYVQIRLVLHKKYYITEMSGDLFSHKQVTDNQKFANEMRKQINNMSQMLKN